MSPRGKWEPHPLSRKRVCCAPPPGTKRGGVAHSPAGEGVGESQFQRLEKKLSTLSTLCSVAFFYIEKGIGSVKPTCDAEK
jgi:hypothetical protein